MDVWEEIEHLDLNAYRAQAQTLLEKLRAEVGGLYMTDCPLYSDRNVPVNTSYG